MSKQTYSVKVVQINSWLPDGSPCVERQCKHKHTTIAGAVRCQRKLLGYDSKTRTWSAAWHRSEILPNGKCDITDQDLRDAVTDAEMAIDGY